MYKLLNYTARAIKFQFKDSSSVVLPSLGVAKCSIKREKLGVAKQDGKFINMNKTTIAYESGLPEPKKDVYLIVSPLVYSALKHKRNDLVIPDRPEGYGENKYYTAVSTETYVQD